MIASVPIAHYAPGRQFAADVTVVCNVCSNRFRVRNAAALRRTELAGENPRTFGIADFAELVSDPCGQCGQHAWASRPSFLPFSAGVQSP